MKLLKPICLMQKAMFLIFLISNDSLAELENFNYQKLEDLIRNKEIVSIEQLIPELPERIRANYLFIYESRSAQAKNVFPNFPRVILPGSLPPTNADVILAFTKDPKESPVVAIVDSLETIQWNNDTKSFEFRELVFNGVDSPLKSPVILNPPKCLACHGADPRPNWDAYNLWPGAFGSITRQRVSAIMKDSNEFKYYSEFMDNNRKSGRYKHLTTEIEDDLGSSEIRLFTNGSTDDPNSQFTTSLTSLNHLRISRLVKKSPNFYKLKPFVAAYLNGCFGRGDTVGQLNIETFFQNQNGYKKFKTLEDEVIADSRIDYDKKLSRFLKNNRGSVTRWQLQPINVLDPEHSFYIGRYLWQTTTIAMFADRLKISTDRWGLSFTDGRWDFLTAYGEIGDFYFSLENEVLDLKSKSCEEIKVISQSLED